jgi:carboxymethylenebutenolidase
MSKTLTLTAADGHTMSAYVAEPDGAPRGGVVVIQEIFGINSHIRSVADGYAAEGYLTVAPALFDRVQPGYETGYTPDDIQNGIEMMQKLKLDQTLADITAAVEYAARGAGKVGVVGYCWGGTMAWVAAARIPGIAAAAPHYGGGISNFASEEPKAKVLLHFGEQDQNPSPEQAKQVIAAHPEVEAHFYPAGHGFNCDQRGSYHAPSAQLARERTVAFFRKHVG